MSVERVRDELRQLAAERDREVVMAARHGPLRACAMGGAMAYRDAARRLEAVLGRQRQGEGSDAT